MVELMKELIRLDKHWIPDQPGYSLYIRPTMSASHERPSYPRDHLLMLLNAQSAHSLRSGSRPPRRRCSS